MICRFLQFLKRYGIIQHKSEKNSGCLKPVKGIGMEPLGGSCMVQFQGRGYGKRAAAEFLSYFRARHSADRLYISVSLDNTAARNMYAALGFRNIGENEDKVQ